MAYSRESWLNCYLDDNGVNCWGSNSKYLAEVPSFNGQLQHLESGDHAVCASTETEFKCWGTSEVVQFMPENLDSVSRFSVYDDYACAINNGAVICWGEVENSYSSVPDDLPTALDIEIGPNHICAVVQKAENVTGVECWGDDSLSQSSPPEDLVNPTQLALGSYHSCAIDELGLVRCWGEELPE